jgi:SAM-dependent methyltransferase
MKTDNYKNLNECLACGSKQLYEYMSLGMQPLANDLKASPEDTKELYPLSLNVCCDCWHSQLGIAIDPKLLYKNYLYVSGTTKTLNDFFDNLAYEKTLSIGAGNVLDIACNDGTFLEKFKKYGWNCYGIDPAENLKELSTSKGLNIQTSFFAGEGYVRPIEKFDLITCFNVLAHVPNPVDFLIEAKNLLSGDGKILVQTSQRDMVTCTQFDTAYHEHHSFFSISSFIAIGKRSGLFIEDVQYTDVHGGSYLITFSTTPNEEFEIAHYKEEYEEGRYSIQLYKDFNKKTSSLYDRVHNTINEYKNKGFDLVGFGAAAKGIVMLNFFSINLNYVLDENSLKIGKYIGGVDTIIKNINDVELENKTCFVILAWNFFDEIVTKIKNRWPDKEYVFLRVFPNVDISE